MVKGTVVDAAKGHKFPYLLWPNPKQQQQGGGAKTVCSAQGQIANFFKSYTEKFDRKG